MTQRLVVVSRQHPDLYVYLRDRFAAEANVEVILDRRLAERRRERVATESEQRYLERRQRQDADLQLRLRSHVIVELPYPA
ncbi:MAG TPA: hypothetical protein VGU22_18155 [Methylomirabilota bacterium]|jgi:hypothetical protein|nr:hypothetical protein [Methylomirabilota bacterium]